LINERIPERFGGEYVKSTQVLTPMKKGPLGTEQLNQQLQSWMNPSGQSFLGSDFKIGDKVIQLTNNYDVELFNGDMGTVIEAGTHDLKVRFSDKEVHYPIDTLSDLALAYACTVHKSQGSEYPIVIMPIYEGHRLMLSLELMYTALTRARKLCVWIGSPEFLENLIQNPRRIERHTFLKDRLAQLP
jgi:exodeoxyribonuclease V alpha subunit